MLLILFNFCYLFCVCIHLIYLKVEFSCIQFLQLSILDVDRSCFYYFHYSCVWETK